MIQMTCIMLFDQITKRTKKFHKKGLSEKKSRQLAWQEYHKSLQNPN